MTRSSTTLWHYRVTTVAAGETTSADLTRVLPLTSDADRARLAEGLSARAGRPVEVVECVLVREERVSVAVA